ncbi:hypothetical protein J2T23_000465 [Pseudarthrobacter niigatensis]|uniref:Uncharacterized protein n=1 Tax=Pseudarthrobacter niigatensis TaxID=369935 RepID=A0AAJ1STI6_9MICC|nr:hypothetical protein [Pseudarthrobacter niigatensis]MDQ0265237.1 hypothetical protein [Pseudarthrobacter niigatensis]
MIEPALALAGAVPGRCLSMGFGSAVAPYS